MKSGFSLEILGLSRKQERVLRILCKGPSTPLALSRESRVSRTSIYAILYNLKKRGLVQSRVTNGKKCWKIAPIAQIEKCFLQAKQPFLNIPVGVQEITRPQMHVIVHEGAEAVKRIIFRIFTETQKKRVRGLQGDVASAGWKKLFTCEDLHAMNMQLKKHNVIMETILPEGWAEKHAIQLGKTWAESQEGRTRRVNTIPSRYFSHGGQLIIFERSVYLLSLNESIIVEIRNEHIYKMIAALFEYIQDTSAAVDNNAIFRSLMEKMYAYTSERQ